MTYGEKDAIGRWSLGKLAFLERYLPAYLRATKPAMHRYYIDGFAGRGQWIDKSTGQNVDGSAAIALQHANKFTHLYFIEYEDDRAKNLRTLIDSYGASHKATVYVGDCNEHLPIIMRKINYKAPTFVFLDPSKDQLQWRSLELLSQWKTELFILFPLNMTILRFLPRRGNQENWATERLDRFFGTREWEDIYKNKSRPYLASELLKLYISRLTNLGYEHINISDIFKSDTGQSLYYMIWVGKHPVGKKIMDTVFEKQSPQLKLF